MFYGLIKSLKKILPKQLFYRGLLIVAIPIIILQVTITLVFFDSLWIKTNKGMTRALASELKTFIDAYDNEKTDKDFKLCRFFKPEYVFRYFTPEFLRFSYRFIVNLLKFLAHNK